ncbi:MAG: Bax inhibitor-1 family protein [Burkholderiales bacterium]|nr:Bax inhibitor-1 family protein [Burkholderiales bacterium]
MTEIVQRGSHTDVVVAERNRVLRNTYALLALTLIPTVIGAWVGVASGLNTLFAGRIWLSLLVFFGGAFAFIWAIERNKTNGFGVALLLGFTFFMGLMLSRLIGAVLGMKNGGDLIMMAFGGTAVIFAGMATLGTVIKKDLSGMGKFLFVGALIVMIGAVAAIFLQTPALTLTILVLCLAIFSAYMLYDINQIVTGGETNYISATLALYLDIFNVFQSLLSLLGIFNSGD